MSNHLIHETSPYLLQHADNPVDWFPWGEEAFSKAKSENKPIFLSIGYSTCHWCHVMAHETFEDAKIAAILNEHFVCIKVDREERPDIDHIYMSVCHVFCGQGGWPLSVFMTGDQQPFFAGTYFPKESRNHQIGFRDLLLAIQEKWTNDHEDLLRQAKFLVEDLHRFSHTPGNASMELPTLAVEFYKNQFDQEHGGFGKAPKFPMPHNLIFLLAYENRYHDMTALQMAEKTLRQMYFGGIFDHIGGGFSRYSTDDQFLVPHFEKMLYDNALLILAYCKAYGSTKNELYLEVAQKTADYILREMTSPEGGFYSAQDADSDGEEGKYYLFTPDEIIAQLGEKTGTAFNRHFDITKEGNFEGRSIPNLLHSDYGEHSLDSSLETLRQYRKERSLLHLDDKILTFWNGLMIAALCELYRACSRKEYLDAAQKADDFLCQHLSTGNFSADGASPLLYVSYCKGKTGTSGLLEDYAGYAMAQLALYHATLETKYYQKAQQLCTYVLSEFKDPEEGGFFLYGNHHENLILRPKHSFDGATPSGNSLMAWNLVRLAQMTGEGIFAEEANAQLNFLATDAKQGLTGYAMYMLALLEYLEPAQKITLVKGKDFQREKVIPAIPHDAIVVFLEEPTKEYPLLDDHTTYYVCKNHSCQPPTVTFS